MCASRHTVSQLPSRPARRSESALLRKTGPQPILPSTTDAPSLPTLAPGRREKEATPAAWAAHEHSSKAVRAALKTAAALVPPEFLFVYEMKAHVAKHRAGLATVDAARVADILRKCCFNMLNDALVVWRRFAVKHR